jgi:hypothetical protein
MRIMAPVGRDNSSRQIRNQLTELMFLHCGRLGTKLE